MRNLRRLSRKFDLDQSERKSLQVNVSATRPDKMESQVDPSIQLASIFESVWPYFSL